MLTEYHAKYFAYELTKRCASDSLEKLSSTLSNAQVDLNPHQIEAALFAFRSPLSKGAILADEVGLGKTIEAGIVLSQRWAERKRKILLIVPSSLRKQWNAELQEKFFLPSIILETKSFNQYIKDGNLNPFNQEDVIIICSYHFARSRASYIKQTKLDLVVIDEAHHLRNVYKTSNKIAKEIKNALSDIPKILLTATPLQNSLLELYGLVSVIDDHVFGDLTSFKVNYSKVSKEQDIFESELGLVEPRQEMFTDLRNRLKPICTRTLRRQVLEYIKYTKRIPLTQDYIPTEQEIELYNGMSGYLQKPRLFALPSSQRQLITLVLRKLLASSSFAIASTLNSITYRLTKLIGKAEKQIAEKESGIEGLGEDFENYDELSDEWSDEEEDEEEEETTQKKVVYTKEDVVLMKQEKVELENYRDLAKKIWKNSKGDALLIALKKGFEMAAELGAKKKAIIFTESRITQDFLLRLLSENGYENKIVLFNGSNNDDKSKVIYEVWFKKHRNTDKVTGSKTADKRAAIIDYFKDEAEIMIATEAGAEGINLQFCSLMINYDLPWNPQRIEQRIGRCHRYGQKYDVVVINFVNRKNAADQRVYELLDEKFNLFKGVFGASDEVLGSIESGVDFEKRIAAIYQSCRTEDEINTAFDALQNEMEESITSSLKDTRQKLLENFDSEVHEKLKVNIKESQSYLDCYERWLWDITRFYLGDNADFAEHGYSFTLKNNPFPEEDIHRGPYRIGKNIEDSHIYRPGHPLAQNILNEVKKKHVDGAELIFDYSNNPSIISVLKSLIGKNGIMKVSNYTIEALEAEDHVLISAFDEKGDVIEHDIVGKLFSLAGQIQNDRIVITNDEKEKLHNIEQETINLISSRSAERNSVFFDDEVDKLDKWADDMKKALELDLKKLDIDIKTAKTNAKKIVELEEKIKVQRQIKDMEKKRNEMRKKLYDSQDEVDVRKESLIARVEAQLKQRTRLDSLFFIKWTVK
ncbi:MAG: DEAD/DEAH box helicase family protein [Candidatus Omnitrophica bacterium]|nr:DEAD/DEAH box helicase family protein [Candidatus Omnitrophota bacterium]MBU4467948.1 DEAD/DEAH box helicase family protein [Candidatus Omnitrophota bacterium]MCG2708601.1 SNF2-related protein [Candidatus Omnitrophota bacterium]